MHAYYPALYGPDKEPRLRTLQPHPYSLVEIQAVPGIRTPFSGPTLTRSQCLQAFWLELSFSSFRRQPGEANSIQADYMWVCEGGTDTSEV